MYKIFNKPWYKVIFYIKEREQDHSYYRFGYKEYQPLKKLFWKIRAKRKGLAAYKNRENDFFKSFSLFSSGGQIRTDDLWVMSPTSYQLLHPAIYRYILL